MKTKLCVSLLWVFAALAFTVNAQTAIFMYQGRLADGATSANGTYQMQFSMYDALSGGAQIGSTITNSSVTVTNGVFTVQLDFSPATPFSTGADRWIEIAVRKAADPPGFTTLTPRQQITSSPYAIRANSAASADTATLATTATTATNNVLKSGDTMTGSLALPSDGLSVGTTQLVASGGNIGIGTGAPSTKLVVNGQITAGTLIVPSPSPGRIEVTGAQGEFSFQDRQSGAWSDDDRWSIYHNGDKLLFKNDTTLRMSIDPAGNVKATGFFTAGTAPDIAETIAASPDVDVSDVVCADPQSRERAVRCGGDARSVLGVISDGSGGFLMNSRAGSLDALLTGKPLVLAGRVPVKVSLENGPIKIGDYLAPSSTPGVAMRASEPGTIVGIALESFNGETERRATVLCFVKVGEGNTSAALVRLRDENKDLRRENDLLKGRLEKLEEAVTNLQARGAK